MFTVLGSIDGVAYKITVPDDGPPTGSGRAVALLRGLVGEQVKVTPTGPVYTVALDNPTSVLAALQVETDVAAVSDGAPATLPAAVPGAVY